MKNFISVNNVVDINALVAKALAYKKNPFANRSLGADKRIGLLFLNPSLRTRLSTQVAAKNLGMEAIVFNVDKEGWALEFEEGAIMSGNTVEHVKDAAPVLGQYFDILCIRTFPSLKNREDDYSELVMNSFVQYSGVPIISLESATLHPLQSLTDILTIKESLNNRNLKSSAESSNNSSEQSPDPLSGEDRRKLNPSNNSPEQSPDILSGGDGSNSPSIDRETFRPKIVLTWAPHVKPLPQCVANSFAQWVNAWGEADFVITHPEDYELGEQYTKGATITTNQNEALKNADFVYVKNWSTYNDYGKIYSNDPAWMLTEEKLKLTNNAKIMHCLPVRRNVELSDEILDSENSLVTKQAGNRVWAAQAVISEILPQCAEREITPVP